MYLFKCLLEDDYLGFLSQLKTLDNINMCLFSRDKNDCISLLHSVALINSKSLPQYKKIKYIKLLVSLGADIKKKDNLGNTPLMYSCINGEDAVLSELYHEDVIKNNQDETAFTLWCKKTLPIDMLLDKETILNGFSVFIKKGLNLDNYIIKTSKNLVSSQDSELLFKDWLIKIKSPISYEEIILHSLFSNTIELKLEKDLLLL